MVLALLHAALGGTSTGWLRKEGTAGEGEQEAERKRAQAGQRRKEGGGRGHRRLTRFAILLEELGLLQEAMNDVACHRDEDATNRKLTGSSLVVSTSPFLPVRWPVTARVIFARSQALPPFFSIILLLESPGMEKVLLTWSFLPPDTPLPPFAPCGLLTSSSCFRLPWHFLHYFLFL